MTDTTNSAGMEIVHATLPPSPEAAREAMDTYQAISAALIVPGDMQKIGKGEFPKRSAFQKLANAYRVSTEIVSDVVDYDDDGKIVRARIRVRAIHPDGRYREGDGTCTAAEKSANDAKLDHDVHGTATTRANNRAISDLIAFGAVSAEEVDPGSAPAAKEEPASLPGWATLITDIKPVGDQLDAILARLGEPDPVAGRNQIGQDISDAVGLSPDGKVGVPAIAATVIAAIHASIPITQETQP